MKSSENIKVLLKLHTSTINVTGSGKNYPHLLKTPNIDRVLYDINVISNPTTLSTGICFPVAFFVKSYIKDIHNIDIELDVLFDEYEHGIFQFCHGLIKYDNIYYDTFWPEGNENLKQFIYADICQIKSVEQLENCYIDSTIYSYLNTILFEKVNNILKRNNLILGIFKNIDFVCY